MVNLKDLAEMKTPYSTTTNFVTDTLREAIIRGIFRSGQQLRQDVIAKELGTSAIPVREAFQALEYQGLVERFPNRGVYVSELCAEDVEEIYELRIYLETKAIALALPHISPDALAHAKELIHLSEETDDPHLKSDLNWQFHVYIYSLSGRKRLIRLIKDMHSCVQHYIRLYTTLAGDNKPSDHDHRELLTLLAEGDEEKVVSYLEDHLDTAREMLISHFREKMEESGD